MQTIRAITISIIILIGMGSSHALSQNKLFARQGIVELSGNISYSSYTTVSNGESGSTLSIFTLAPQIGVFVSDGLELGIKTGISLLPGVSIISVEDGSTTTIFGLFFAPSYNFKTSSETLFPFFEGQAGYTSLSSGSSTASGFSYGGRAGLKIAVSGGMLLTFSAEYLALTLNPEGADERSGFNYLNIGIGVGGFF